MRFRSGLTYECPELMEKHLNVRPLACSSKPATNVNNNHIKCSAKRRAEQTSRLVGAATQLGRLRLPNHTESTRRNGNFYLSVAMDASDVVPSSGRNTVSNPQLLLSARPPSCAPYYPSRLCSTGPEVVQRQPRMADLRDSCQGVGFGQQAPAQPSVGCPEAEHTGGNLASSTTITMQCSSKDSLLTELCEDATVLTQSQDVCLAALDRLAHASSAVARSPRHLSLTARAEYLTLLLSLRHHCRARPRSSNGEKPRSSLSLQQLFHVSRQLVRIRSGRHVPTDKGRLLHHGSASAAAEPLMRLSSCHESSDVVGSAAAALSALVDELAGSAACRLRAAEEGKEEELGAGPLPSRGVRFDTATATGRCGPGGDVAATARCGAAILHNLMKLGPGECGDGVQNLLEAVAASRESLVPSLDVRPLQDLIWAMGKLGSPLQAQLPARQLLEALAARLCEPGLLNCMAPIGLSMVVYGMGKGGFTYTNMRMRTAVAAAVAAACAKGAPGCEPQAIANIAWGLSRLAPIVLAPPLAGSDIGPATRAASLQLQYCRPVQGPSSVICESEIPELAACVQLSKAAIRQLDHFKPREVANLLGGLATLGASMDPQVQPLLDACRIYLRTRVYELAPQDVAEILYAYAIAAAMAAPVPRWQEAVPQHRSGHNMPDMLPMNRQGSLPSEVVQEPQLMPLPWQQVRFTTDAEDPAPPATGVVHASGIQRDSELWALLEQRCIELLPRCPIYQVATMLWAFTHLEHRPAGLVTAVVAALAHRPHEGEHAAAQHNQKRDRGSKANLLPSHVGPGQLPVSASIANGSAATRFNRLHEPQDCRNRSHHKHKHLRQQGQQLAPQPGRQANFLAGDSCLGLVLELESLPGIHMARLVWALAKLGAKVPLTVLRRLCGALRSRIADFDSQSLLMTTWGLATLGRPGDTTLELVVGRLVTLLPSLNPEQLQMALWSVAKLTTTSGCKSPPSMSVLQFFQASRGPLATALPRLAPQGVAMVAWAYSTAGINPGEAALAALWEQAVEVAAAAATTAAKDLAQALAMIVGAMAEFRCRHERLTRAVLIAAMARMAAPLSFPSPSPAPQPSNYGLQSASVSRFDMSLSDPAAVSEGVWLSSIVCSLGRLGVYDAQVFELACRRVRVLAPWLTPREAVPLLWGLGVISKRAGIMNRVGDAIIRDSSNSNRDSELHGGSGSVQAGAVSALTEVIERAIMDAATPAPAPLNTPCRALRPDSAEGTAIVGGDMNGGRGSHGPGLLDGGLLSMFLIACVSHRHRPALEVLEATSMLLQRRLHRLASHTLCEIVWALAMLRIPAGGDIGINAMLPLVPASAAGADANAEAAASVLNSIRPSQRARGDHCCPKTLGSSICEDIGDCKRYAASNIFPASGCDSGVSAARNTGGKAAEAPKPVPQLQHEFSTREVAGCMDRNTAPSQRLRLTWPLRWARDEAPLVLAESQQRRRRQQRPSPPRHPTRLGNGVQIGKRRPLMTAVSIAADRLDVSHDDLRVSAAREIHEQPNCAGPAAPKPPPTPHASHVAPIYPPRRAIPTNQIQSQRLLARCLGLLGRRLCVERSEVLTLESLVKVSWAMCVLRMYTPRLFRYCSARAMCCCTTPLEGHPSLLRALVQVRALVARQRPSTWHRLRLRSRWLRRKKAGATWNVPPAALLDEAPPALVRRLQRCRASLDAAAEAAGLLLEWRNTFEGDRHGVLWLGSRTSCALLVVPPWEEEEGLLQGRDAVMEGGATAGSLLPPPPLGPATVAARLLLLRGWLVACVRVERWLALGPEEQRRQLVALHAQMRAAARARAEAMGTMTVAGANGAQV